MLICSSAAVKNYFFHKRKENYNSQLKCAATILINRWKR